VTHPAGFRGTFREDDAARGVYAEAAGIARIIPVAVAVPADPDDVVTLVQWAQATHTALIPRGSGSSMSGAAVGPGVIVDLSQLNAAAPIGPVDPINQRVTVAPGAIANAVDRAAATVGLRFPVDPSSAAFCTVGGMAATNAAGAHTLHFGSMRRWVTALDCVFADGTRATIRRHDAPPNLPLITRFLADVAPTLNPVRHEGVRKDSSGYAIADYIESHDLIDLLVGSEGTLALFVGLELALTPRPTRTASLLAAFPSLDAAVAGTVAARRVAVACELLDKTFLDVAASGGAGPHLPAGTEAVLLIELENPGVDDAKALGQALTTAGASRVDVALDPAAEHALWELRHAASPILSRLDPSLKSMQFIEDGAVPPEHLADYVRGVRASLARHRMRGVIFGHAGDAHIHVNPLVDVREADWRPRLDAILADVTALTAHLGGTLTGEHGDGRLRTPLLDEVWPQVARDQFARIKHAFDPENILNPGVKVPLPGQRPVTDVKYDPTLPPLPATARAALATVERDRAYATPRLALLDPH
jgi:FAD/FMN-containing dehydrogenase